MLRLVSPRVGTGCAAVGSKFDELIIPGLFDSGPDHWQSHWLRSRAQALKVELGAWDNPTIEQWVARLDRAVARRRERVILVAQSLNRASIDGHRYSSGSRRRPRPLHRSWDGSGDRRNRDRWRGRLYPSRHDAGRNRRDQKGRRQSSISSIACRDLPVALLRTLLVQ